MYFELGVIFLIFVLSYILISKNFKIAIYLLLVLSVLLHKELFSFFRWDLMPIRAFMLALVCVGITKIYIWLFKTDKKKKLQDLSIFKDPFILLVILLWLVRGISIIFSKNLQSSLLLYSFFTTIVVLVIYLVTFLKKNPQEIEKYLKFYILLVFGLTLFGYFQYYLYSTTGKIIGAFWNIPGNIARVGATFWDVNHYGALLAATLPISCMYVLYTKAWKGKLFYLFVSLSILVTLFLTNSRTSWIIDGVAGLTFAAVFMIKKFGFKSLKYLFITLLLITLPLLREYSIKDSKFRAEIKQYFHYRMDSFDSHFMLLTGAFQIFAKYPILGGGYGGFFEHFSQTDIAPTFFGRDPAALNTRVPAHTIWGEAMAETGVIGLSIWSFIVLTLLGVLIRAVFKARDTKSFMFSAAMFSIVLGWMIGGIFYSYNSEFFWIILCLFLTYGISVLGDDYNINKLVSWFVSSNKFIPLILVILGFCLIFLGLGDNHLVPWDESIYAKIAKNMVVNNEYITQQWKPNIPWYEKPPLYMWMMAGFMKILDFTSLAAKLPSAIFGFLTLFVVYAFGKKLFNKTVGFISSFSLLTTVGFLYYSRQAMTDITSLFFITLALYLYYLAKDENKIKYWVLSGISVGFAVMTKGVIGLLPFPIIGIYEFYLFLSKQQKFNTTLVKKYLVLFISSFVIFMPWHIAMYREFGMTFINQYLGYHVIARATEAIENKGQPWWWYFIVLKVSMRLWFIALLGSLPVILFKIFGKKNVDKNKLIFVSIWGLFIFTFFSIAKSKLVWYIIPIYAPLSLLVGFFLERVLDLVINKLPMLNNITFKFLSITLLVVFSLMYLYYNKELVYPSDLSGPPARLLMMKDSVLGTKDRFFIDRVELPLVMFYTDSPYEILDYQPERGRTPNVFYEEPMIVLAKRGRSIIQIPGIRADKVIIGEEKDWVLFYYESEKDVDADLLQKVRAKLEDKAVTSTELKELKLQEETILQHISDYSGRNMYYPSL